MIDLQEAPPSDTSRLRLLIVKSGAPGGYCTGGQDWAELLHKSHPASYVFPYQEIYRREGSRGLKEALLRAVADKDINSVYIDGLFRSEFDVPFLEALR